MVQKVSEKVRSIRSTRRKRDHCVGIGFKANPTGDQDILAWWHGLPAGTRSDALRQALRSALFPTQPSSSELQFIQMSDDMKWIRRLLSELPSLLERQPYDLHQGAAFTVVNVSPDSSSEAAAQLNGDELEHRRDRLLKAAW